MAETTLFADTGITDTILNLRMPGWGSAFPGSWTVDGFFFRIDQNRMYQNQGTFGTPSWILMWETVGPGIIFALG